MKIGIVGGGQLGRMLAMAAKKLGHKVVVLDPTPSCPAAEVALKQIVGDFKDADKIRELSAEVDTLTFEIESANARALEELASEGRDINPSPRTLAIIKDKFEQKRFLEEHGIPVASSLSAANMEDILRSARSFSYPILVKARFDAYDGRGNALVANPSEIGAALEKLNDRSLYVEKFIPFKKELAVVVARGKDGEVLPYPPVETIHKNNICHLVISPAPVARSTSEKAEGLAARIMDHLGGVGVFCIEMFLTPEDEVIVNEIAPRVHNSGHHSIEAHETSQFEQHIRAITGMPLGTIGRTSPYSVMINVLGERNGPALLRGLGDVSAMPGTFVHVYNKLETRWERKMGHITVLGNELQAAVKQARLARSMISI
ncbi:MAG: 5-(carboxyamino)imidazole ribonucleotide synthase [Candidatus Parcubacteria bacterium]|jgi:5-(carboxyamino)imidazole ribonucleotide synthase|nr:5-(carboxyamino)imidazole ribonucleotide synthase [Candidatus Parcubacteria bacterium]